MSDDFDAELPDALRAAKANREAFDAVLASVPAVEPEEYDKL